MILTKYFKIQIVCAFGGQNGSILDLHFCVICFVCDFIFFLLRMYKVSGVQFHVDALTKELCTSI